MKFIKIKDYYGTEKYINLKQVSKIVVDWDSEKRVWPIRFEIKNNWYNAIKEFTTKEDAEKYLEHLDWYCVPKKVENFEINRG